MTKFAYTLEEQALNQKISKQEEKNGKNIKTMLAITFLLALMGAALDLLA